MKKNRSNKSGFSLIEALFASAILVFILVAFVVLYVNFFKFYNRQQAEMKIGDSARNAVKELQSAALQANKIAASHDFSGTVYSTDQDTLVLEIPSIDGSGNIISGKYDYAVFYVTGENLYKLTEADASSSRPSNLKQLSESISTITFTCNNPDLALANKVDADIQMETSLSGQTISYHLYQQIYLRNK
jgi:type II secretory pathway pseudopilin PulG